MKAANRSYKKFLLVSLVLLIICRLLMVMINYAVDPYGIFQTNILPHSGLTNQRYAKVEHILNSKGKYNSFIFGNSVAGVIDPNVIEKYMPGTNFYNMSLNSGSIYEYSITLYAMLKNGVPVRNVFLMLNVNALNKRWLRDFENPVYRRGYYQFRLHPYLLRNIDKWKYYLEYLFQFHNFSIKTKIINNIKPYQDMDILDSGIVSWPTQEALISANPEKYIKTIDSLNEDVINRNVPIEVKKVLKEIVEFKTMCNVNNIKLMVVISPANYNLLNRIITLDYLLFLDGLSDEMDYWNFSGYNSVAMDKKNFYEWEHFRPFIADLMIQKIFNDYSGPEDFGYLVTKNSVGTHLKNMEEQFSKADKEFKK